MEMEYPDKYTCPITMDLMIDPVKASDNKIYEKDAIIDWLKKNKESPITREILKNDLIFLPELKDEINTFRNKFNINTRPYSPKNSFSDIEESESESENEHSNLRHFGCMYCSYPVEFSNDITDINCTYCLKKYILLQCKDCYYGHIILKKRRGNFYCINCNAINIFYTSKN